uniref:Retrotransposon gag domain-containing protein n=1 Tax=Peronospora matthiolae TaxID=2874970 RepID=A0AAV1UMZ7_9STRA
MNMLDVEDESFHVTRVGYSHPIDSEWEVVGRMSVLTGKPAISGMLESQRRDQQRAAINKFLQGELAVERQKIALLQQQGFHQSMGGPTHMCRLETLKIDNSRYKGTDEDSLFRWFVELDDAIRARHIEGDEMQVTFALSNLTGRTKAWSLGLKLHDPNVFESLEILKSRLKETFEPPRAEFRARSALLRLNQGKRYVHAYAQHLIYLASSVKENPVDEHTLINVFIYGLVNGPVKTYMFREDFHTLERAIAYAEQEDLSLRQSQADSSNYRPTRRHETGGPEPMDLCCIESEKSRSLSHKRTSRCHRCQKIRHYAYECSVPSTATRPKTGRDDHRWPRKVPRRGSDHVAKPRQQVGPSKKRTRSVGAEHAADPANSREYAGLLTKIAPNTQSMCGTAFVMRSLLSL